MEIVNKSIMRLPKRRSQILKTVYDNEEVLLTSEGLERLKHERERLDKIDRPQAVADVAEARRKGDLSENAEYQEARARLSRLQSRIFYLDEKLKHVKSIEIKQDGRVRMGSTVVLLSDKNTKIFQIVGPYEADILRGRISHLSPLGSALIDRAPGDSVAIPTQRGEAVYKIVEVR